MKISYCFSIAADGAVEMGEQIEILKNIKNKKETD